MARGGLACASGTFAGADKSAGCSTLLATATGGCCGDPPRIAYLTSFGSLLLTLFPVLGQLYWLWIVWGTTGVFFNWFTIACLVWLGLVALSLAVLAKTRTDAQ